MSIAACQLVCKRFICADSTFVQAFFYKKAGISTVVDLDLSLLVHRCLEKLPTVHEKGKLERLSRMKAREQVKYE